MNCIRTLEFYIAMLLISTLAAPSHTFAQNSSLDFSECLPPVAGSQYDESECGLTYSPPPLLRQDIVLTNCSFLPGRFRTKEQTYKRFQCSITNGTEEAVKSVRYGVRYFDSNRDSLLAEGEFEERPIFSTAYIDGNLQPGEERSIKLVGPGVPPQIDSHKTKIVVEVLGVFVPGSGRHR